MGVVPVLDPQIAPVLPEFRIYLSKKKTWVWAIQLTTQILGGSGLNPYQIMWWLKTNLEGTNRNVATASFHPGTYSAVSANTTRFYGITKFSSGIDEPGFTKLAQDTDWICFSPYTSTFYLMNDDEFVTTYASYPTSSGSVSTNPATHSGIQTK